MSYHPCLLARGWVGNMSDTGVSTLPVAVPSVSDVAGNRGVAQGLIPETDPYPLAREWTWMCIGSTLHWRQHYELDSCKTPPFWLEGGCVTCQTQVSAHYRLQSHQ